MLDYGLLPLVLGVAPRPTLLQRLAGAAQEAHSDRILTAMHDFAIRLELPGRDNQPEAGRQRHGALNLDHGPAGGHVAHHAWPVRPAARASDRVTDRVAAAKLSALGATWRRVFHQPAFPRGV
jgi:hypothetical protein